MEYTSLKQIKELYTSVFYMEEVMIIDIILALTISTKLQGDPIWLMIIGGSSSGKSELINMLNKVKFNHAISSMTENTFLSNMKLQDGKEASLLHRIGSNGMITMKDYTSILSMRSEKREIIVSQMREIFDGALTKESGNGQTQKWKGKINWIGAVTDSIYIKEGESAGMGRRALNYVMPQQDRMKMLDAASKNTSDIEKKRDDIQNAVKSFIEYKLSTLTGELPALEDSILQKLKDLANFITIARTPTERNFRGELILVPDSEGPMRAFSMLKKLMEVMVYNSDEGMCTEEHFQIIKKIAFDSIPKQRTIPLKVLTAHKNATKKAIAMKVNYPTDTIGTWLEDLNVVNIVTRRAGPSGDIWSLKEEYVPLLMEQYKVTQVNDTLIDENEESFDTDGEIQPTWFKSKVDKGIDDKGELKDIQKSVDTMFDEL